MCYSNTTIWNSKVLASCMQFTAEYRISFGGIYIALEVCQIATIGLALQLQNNEIKTYFPVGML